MAVGAPTRFKRSWGLLTAAAREGKSKEQPKAELRRKERKGMWGEPGCGRGWFVIFGAAQKCLRCREQRQDRGTGVEQVGNR